MEIYARLFNCLHCQQQTFICSSCDRGNIYCGSKCSVAARKYFKKQAGQRYQNSRQGRFKHAARQRRYQQAKNKMTHHPCSLLGSHDLISPTLNKTVIKSTQVRVDKIICHFCEKICESLIRVGFIKEKSRKKIRKTTTWPGAP